METDLKIFFADIFAKHIFISEQWMIEGCNVQKFAGTVESVLSVSGQVLRFMVCVFSWVRMRLNCNPSK